MSERGHWGHPDYDAREEEAGSSYWRGSLQVPEPGDSAPGEGQGPHAPSYGSMSAAARRSYASEAIRSKDHVSAGLLAVFLGMFGIHKFYLGCNNAGFIMLAVSIIGGICTFGLASAVIWVIAIVEGLIYFTKSQTEFDRIYVLNQRDWF